MSERQVVMFLVLAFVVVGATSVATGLYSLSRIDRELAGASDFHTSALFEILAINKGISEAVQESMAYALSGNVEEKVDYQEQLKEVTRRMTAYLVIAHLDRPGEESELAFFQSIRAEFSQLRARGNALVAEFDNTGAVSHGTFEAYEDSIDAIGLALDRLILAEETEVTAAEANALAVIERSKNLVILQGIATLAVTLLVAYLAARMLRQVFAAREAAEREARIVGQAVESAAVGIVFADASDPQLPIRYANQAFEKITGYAADEVIGRNCKFLQGPATNQEYVDKIRAALAEKEPVNVLLENHTKEGKTFWNDLTISPVRDERDQVTHFVGVINDVTDRINLERQLLQSQKMDAVGQLAGGIAHDFNNYLTVISGAAQLLSDGDGSETELWTRQIIDAGERTSALTRQLLAFARQQVLDPQDLNINDVLSSISPFLRSTIGEHIALEFVEDGSIGTIRMDGSQLEQVIINLVINSRDAMPEGGTVTIETGDVTLSEEYARNHAGVTAGRHVMLAVSDTGTGIDPEIIDTIFEPFVTSKGPGEGTGLGLATVYGIVKQSGATINFYSERGRGTTFKIYFRCVDLSDEGDQLEGPEPSLSGEGVILLVEDDPIVRRVSKAMLEKLGFTVVEAQDGVAGLELFRQRDDIRLLLTDITMPRMGGIDLAAQARQLRPGISVLFMSGYTQNGIVHHGLVDPGHVLMQKPFTRKDLIRKLQEALGLNA